MKICYFVLITVLLVVFPFGCLRGGDSPSMQPSDTVGVKAKRADNFVDNIGVATHFLWTGTGYGTYKAELIGRLQEVGIHHIRESCVSAMSEKEKTSVFKELGQLGIRLTLIIDHTHSSSTPYNTYEIRNNLELMKNEYLQYVEAVTGPNEPEILVNWKDYYNADVTNWQNLLTNWQKELYNYVKSSSELRHLEVGSPPSGRYTIDTYRANFPDLHAFSDFLDFHPYFNGRPMEIDILDKEAWMKEYDSIHFKNKKVHISETGYHNALDVSGGISQLGASVYSIRMLLEYFRKDYMRIFIYQLYDFKVPELNYPGSLFAIIDHDRNPKLVFYTLKNLISVLSDPGGLSFQTTRLDYDVIQKPDDFQQVLMQKQNGDFYLAIWRVVSVWDTKNHVDLDPSVQNVTISFNMPVQEVSVYEPNVSGNIQSTYDSPSQVTIPLKGTAKILKIVPVPLSGGAD